MKLALIGGTGTIGSRILDEALARGHQVLAIARDPDELPAQPRLVAKQGDTHAPDTLARLLHGQDAVLVSVNYVDNDIDQIIDAIRRSGVTRCLLVVGAGSLLRADGRTHAAHMADRGITPPTSKAAALALAALREVTDLEWTAISPADTLFAGARTGSFRFGHDHLVADDQGISRLSRDDFAIAILDEIEDPKHVQARFTAAY